MNAERESEQQLEQQVRQLLGALPPRRAPQSLVPGVLERLANRAERAADPWWRRQVTQWPALARVLFALSALLLMLLSLGGSASLTRLPQAVTPGLGWTHPLAPLARITAALLGALLHALPVPWLQAGIVVALCSYLFLFGFGAAAYRLLYLER